MKIFAVFFWDVLVRAMDDDLRKKKEFKMKLMV